MIAPYADEQILQPRHICLRLMSVTLAHMTATLTAPSTLTMSDASIDADTTRLAVEARGGDEASFSALIALHERAARRVAAAALGNSPDVDEAVQDACLTAWTRIGSLEDPAAFRAWLLRITWRKALDRRRSVRSWLKRVVERRNINDATTSTATDSLDRLVDPQENIVDQLIHDERERTVARVIRSLPSKLRDPFLLAASGEHRYEDIAAMLSIPVGTLKWRVSEARRVLRQKLAHLETRR